MIANGTRVETTEGYSGTVYGEPENTFAGATVTVALDDEFHWVSATGTIDVPVSELTEI